MRRILNPETIKKKSFEIINKRMPRLNLSRRETEVVKRVVHATADLGYTEELVFHPQAIRTGLEAIHKGKNIITDANMVLAGIDKKKLSRYGGKAICLISDPEVLRQAAGRKITRAITAMRKSADLTKGGIVAIGNAPTALFELINLAEKGAAGPALIIGTPVGFVGAREAKESLLKQGTPFITNRSEKGGSSVAAAIVNALLNLADKNRRR